MNKSIYFPQFTLFSFDTRLQLLYLLSLDKKCGKGTPRDRVFVATPFPWYSSHTHTECTKIYHTNRKQ